VDKSKANLFSQSAISDEEKHLFRWKFTDIFKEELVLTFGAKNQSK
jgi:hypothetical protein